MPKIPIPVGAGEFAPQWRLDQAQDEFARLSGIGGYPEEPGSVFQLTLSLPARLQAGVSLSIERLRNQIFSRTMLAEDLLPAWELSLRIPDREGSLESRRARVGTVKADRGAPTGIAIRLKLEALVGGSVSYLFNTAAALDAAGDSRLGIYQIGFEVPAAAIETAGQHDALRRIVAVYVPTHVNFAIGRPIGAGFLCDDPDSRTDRDMLRI